MKPWNEKNCKNLWSAIDPLTIHQAAALIAGCNPTQVFFNGSGAFDACDFGTPEPNDDATTAFIALRNAINGGTCKARLIFDAEPRYFAGIDNLFQRSHFMRENVREVADADLGEECGTYVIGIEPNWGKSLVSRGDVAAWLKGIGIHNPIFHGETKQHEGGKPQILEYLDKEHPRYSPKLAAAIKVWLAMEDESITRGKPIKKAMTNWLTSRYKELGLWFEREEKINNTGIEQVVNVANWNTTGGAPKTPQE